MAPVEQAVAKQIATKLGLEAQVLMAAKFVGNERIEPDGREDRSLDWGDDGSDASSDISIVSSLCDSYGSSDCKSYGSSDCSSSTSSCSDISNDDSSASSGDSGRFADFLALLDRPVPEEILLNLKVRTAWAAPTVAGFACDDAASAKRNAPAPSAFAPQKIAPLKPRIHAAKEERQFAISATTAASTRSIEGSSCFSGRWIEEDEAEYRAAEAPALTAACAARGRLSSCGSVESFEEVEDPEPVTVTPMSTISLEKSLDRVDNLERDLEMDTDTESPLRRYFSKEMTAASHVSGEISRERAIFLAQETEKFRRYASRIFL